MLHQAAQRDARAAIIATLGTAIGIALLPGGSYLAYLVVWFGVVTVGAAAGIAPLALARRGFIALPFILAAAPLIFIRADEVIWSGALGPLSLSVSGAGLRVFLSAAIKSWISVQVALLLVHRYSIESIVGSLRALKLPDALATGAGLTIRYLDLLRGEATRMIRARASRSASPIGVGGARIGGSLPWRAKVTGNLVGALFLRAYARAARVEEAATARGASGSLSLGALRNPDPRFALKAIFALATLAVTLVIGAVAPRF